MTREEIIKEINDEMVSEFEISPSDIKPEAEVYDTLHLDSLSLVDLIGIVQYKFKVLIPTADIRSIKTFNDLYDYIETHQPK